MLYASPLLDIPSPVATRSTRDIEGRYGTDLRAILESTPRGYDQGQDLVATARAVGQQWNDAQRAYDRLAAIHESLAVRGSCALTTRTGARIDAAADGALSRIKVRRIASLVLALQRIARARDVQLVLDADSTLSRLPDRLTQTAAMSIIGNLLQNAVDVLDDPRFTHRVVTCMISDGQHHLRVRVRAAGPARAGLPDRGGLASAFSTKAGHPGVGLDLVDRLVREAGGSLHIDRLRVGTAFEVTIPYD